MSTESKLTFNETGKEVSIFRKYLVEYLNTERKSASDNIIYKVKYYKGQHSSKLPDDLCITASNRLEATIKLFDYLNQNHREINPRDIYDGHTMLFNHWGTKIFLRYKGYDILPEMDDTLPEKERHINFLFKTKAISSIINYFLDNAVFKNTRDVWLEE